MDGMDTAFLLCSSSCIRPRGGSRISGKGDCMYKGMGVRFTDFSLFFLNIHENEIVWSQLFLLMGYLKTGAGWGFERTT